MVGKGFMEAKRGPTRYLLVGMVIVALVIGNISMTFAQSPIPSLKTVPVPEPDNLGDFVKDREAAIALGKAFFWDMQVGSDGIQACASCHFANGVDSRSKNQLSPGLLRVDASGVPDPDHTFDRGVNYTLTPDDFPFHKLEDPNDRNSTVLHDINDVASSQGVFNSIFNGIVLGRAEELVTYQPDPDGFQVGGINVRRVEPRNTPTMINAVFNFRNFWDGRAQNDFNGVNSFGSRDPNAYVYKAVKNELVKITVSLNNSSLASQAVAPPLSAFEMSADGRTFQTIGEKFGRSLPRDKGKKLLPLRPLGKQIVHPEDSVLGGYSRAPKRGLDIASYEEMIKAAFKPEWWRSNKYIQINSDGSRTVVDKKTSSETYTQMAYNFSLFFGLAVQMYEATLVSDDTPFDRFAEGDEGALTEQQEEGLQVFIRRGCSGCHGGPEFTDASVTKVSQGKTRIFRGQLNDQGFFNIGVRPTVEDLGVGGKDPFGNPLSEARLVDPAAFAVEGAFKAPGLRNVELTAPYFHNGGQLTLRQVVDFYEREGDFVPILALNGSRISGLFAINFANDQEKEDLVAFLTALTDERVRYRKAPFDHPQLFVPNGHSGDHTSVTDDGTGKATDSLMEIPAVGRNGGTPLAKFLEP